MYLNNGKVKIGSLYCLNPLKPKYVEKDTDMLLIQKYLICDPALIRREKILTRGAELAGALVLLFILLKEIS